MKSILILLALIGSTIIASAQPFTKQYIMAYHTCDAACSGFSDHVTRLAESDDGVSWTEVPGFPTYNGSVPDVIIRGNKLYLFNPGKVKRYDNGTGTWDAASTNISIQDQSGNTVNFVDPSAYIDDDGNIVLFYLNSTGIVGMDPASCSPYPCDKVFNSAVEVPGSDGTQFIQEAGDRLVITLTSGTGSDPDIFYDGTQYIMYVSRGGSTDAYHSSSLHGTYTTFSGLGGSSLTAQGGIPCGMYVEGTSKYHTYVHANVGGETIIRLAQHDNFNATLGFSNFNTVVSGTLMGYGSNVKTESPGICENNFSSTYMAPAAAGQPDCRIFLVNDEVRINLQLQQEASVQLVMYNALGQTVSVPVDFGSLGKGSHQLKYATGQLPAGFYVAELKAAETSIRTKLLKTE